MRRALPVLLLAVAVRAGDAPTAKEILRKAVEAQGVLRREQVHDVRIAFVGEISEDGRPNTVLRTYWYRSSDRSFRVRTGSGSTDKLTTERGAFGADGFWERGTDGSIVELRRGNRDDAESIGTIERDRGDFERMLRMVLLTHLDDWNVAFGEPAPVKLERDHPHEPRRTLGDREKETYHVLDATREGEPRLRLYVNTSDFTVRKAVEYDAEAPDGVRWVYYFAAYRKFPELNLLLPQYLSIYRDTPVDERSRDGLNTARGQPTVSVNMGLKDADLRPAGRAE
jgi:hypothetical protein